MKIIYLLIFLLVAVSVHAQNSLLWEISGNGLKSKSYLYGTIHIQDKRVFQFSDSLMPRFNACSVFAGELLLQDNDPMELMKIMFMPGDTTLKMLLNKHDYKLVEEYSKKHLGSMSGMIDRIKPLFTSTMITETSMKKDEPYSLDEYFQRLAKEKNMTVMGIETMEEQMKALDRISLKEQAQLLVEGIKEEQKNADTTEVEKLILVYLSQNLDSIQRYYISDQSLSDEFNKSIIIERNHKMAERIDTLIKRRPAFIGVGAGHLPGQEGVIALLKQKGYTVKVVTAPFNKNNIVNLTEASEGGWIKYEPVGETFKVLIPSTPTIGHDSVGSGNVTWAMCPDSSGHGFYMITHFNVPNQVAQQQTDHYYNELINKLTKNKNSKLIYKMPIEQKGVKGMEAEIKLMLGQVMRLRIFLYNGKAIQLAVAGSKDAVSSANSEKFFNSFSF